MMKTIAAYTRPEGSFPPYLSVCEVDDEIVIIVRSEPTRDLNGARMQGSTGSIRMSREDFDETFKGLF
jgi:hypothetical protein